MSLDQEVSACFQENAQNLWQYDNLVANRDIHLTLPQRLSFTQRIAALQDDFQAMASLAPLLLVLFVGATVIVFPWYQINLPLPNHLLMGLGFILFYPLITFLSGLVGAIPAALLSAVIIVSLLLLFVRQVTPLPGPLPAMRPWADR